MMTPKLLRSAAFGGCRSGLFSGYAPCDCGGQDDEREEEQGAEQRTQQ
ncbi:hypothetical protein [Pseudomonas indica]